jgi:hypothetical protein
MQSHFFGPLKSSNQFRAIEGVITFFLSKNLGAPNSWISYVDTGIVEGIQRGGAMALGLSTDTGRNPGSALWRDFFVGQRDGTFKTRKVSRRWFYFAPFCFTAATLFPGISQYPIQMGNIFSYPQFSPPVRCSYPAISDIVLGPRLRMGTGGSDSDGVVQDRQSGRAGVGTRDTPGTQLVPVHSALPLDHPPRARDHPAPDAHLPLQGRRLRLLVDGRDPEPIHHLWLRGRLGRFRRLESLASRLRPEFSRSGHRFFDCRFLLWESFLRELLIN